MDEYSNVFTASFAVGDHRRAHPGLFQHLVEISAFSSLSLCRQNTHVRQIELVPLAGFYRPCSISNGGVHFTVVPVPSLLLT